MKHRKLVVAAAALTIALLATAGVVAAGSLKNYGTHLKGVNEVPARETNAQGQAVFKLSSDGQSLDYKLIVANIDNVVASHIHVGAGDVNGPVVAFLYGNAAPGGGGIQGVIGEGTITAANLVGPLAGQPLSALIAEINAGNTYVNVHTNDGIAPTNTGAGDFASGEIRNQIAPHGH